jgi:hypothetical protein
MDIGKFHIDDETLMEILMFFVLPLVLALGFFILIIMGYIEIDKLF